MAPPPCTYQIVILVAICSLFLIYRNTIFYTCFVKFSWDAIAPILQEP